jgi:predicted RNA binding protein YcfA (HicA-like mRNA interferase family)
MKLPRDVSGSDLAKALRRLGYENTRQTGSHLRLTTAQNGEHHLTVPLHNPLKVGDFSGCGFSFSNRARGIVAEAFSLRGSSVAEVRWPKQAK